MEKTLSVAFEVTMKEKSYTNALRLAIKLDKLEFI